MTTIILDTDVGEPWIEAIPEFEQKLEALKTRVRVKAARDMAEVAEGLRIVVRVADLTHISHVIHLGVAGRNQTASFLSRSVAAHTYEYDDKFASCTELNISQISATLCFSPATCSCRGQRSTEGICRRSSYFL